MGIPLPILPVRHPHSMGTAGLAFQSGRGASFAQPFPQESRSRSRGKNARGRDGREPLVRRAAPSMRHVWCCAAGQWGLFSDVLSLGCLQDKISWNNWCMLQECAKRKAVVLKKAHLKLIGWNA